MEDTCDLLRKGLMKKNETWNGGKRGSALKVGDIVTFPYTKIHRITKLEPYKGPLAHLFPEGAQLATFDTGIGMTIDNGDYYA